MSRTHNHSLIALLTAISLALAGGWLYRATPWLREWLLIAFGTLISEDLTTIHVGVLAMQGRIGYISGTLACFFGIFLGDVLLYLAGRFIGAAALQRAPLKWFLSEAAVARCSHWLQERGVLVIVLSRFVPGTRLPTYFAAGMLRTSFKQFSLYFLLASALWTPLLVALSAWLGGAMVLNLVRRSGFGLLVIFVFALGLMLFLRMALQLTTWRGRRLFIGRWRRIIHWEFWPPYVFYPPVMAYLIWLAIKHRHATLFTAANPAMPASGFIGESKSAILNGLRGAGDFIARYELISAQSTPTERLAQAEAFMRSHQLSFPIVLKPDAGQRGAGVQIIRSHDQLSEALASLSNAHIIQEYIAGLEFGVFYVRVPDAKHGTIFSITEKHFPQVTGDGKHTLEQLVLSDERAVCMAQIYEARLQARWLEIIPSGETITLAELGSHCRGAIFCDGQSHLTHALAATIDRISQTYEGFYFGRYDIRVPSLAGFQTGRDLKVIELNGVTAEATNIYDRRNRVWSAYRILFAQWRAAFAIGQANHARGARTYGLTELRKMIKEFKELGN